MKRNSIIDTMLKHKSIRKYTEEMPSEEVIHLVVRAGQQAPFASQLCSLLLTRKKPIRFGAPLLFTICIDFHRMELIMSKRGWQKVTNDLSMLFFGIQDASLVAENMVIAAESFGMGSCFLGAAPYIADKIAEEYKLPPRVFPIVQLTMGYPAENPPPRPRYPINFTLFEDQYPDLGNSEIEQAMQQMDDGYLAQGYYSKGKIKIPLHGGRDDKYTYADYSWTEHISRKWGQWYRSPQELLKQLSKRGFDVALPEKDATESLVE